MSERTRSANEGSGTAEHSWNPRMFSSGRKHCCSPGLTKGLFHEVNQHWVGLAAALIPGRDFVFVGVDVFGTDLPFHFAQRCLIACEIRLRAAALICRRVPVVVEEVFGGRPRRAGERRAAMARSMRVRCSFSAVLHLLYPWHPV